MLIFFNHFYADLKADKFIFENILTATIVIFAVQWNKRAHQQTHDLERLFSCTQCNKSFFVEEGLRDQSIKRYT